jgi:hypothetical protein
MSSNDVSRACVVRSSCSLATLHFLCATLRMQTPSVLKLAATMFPNRTDETLDSCAKQICDYVRLRVSDT